jgi:ubiquinone biosynthesis protein
MGHLDPLERLGLTQLFVGLFRGETDRVVQAMAELGIATTTSDRRKLTRDLDRLRLRYYGLDLAKIRARSFFEDLMRLAFANRLIMPSNLVLVFKAIAMLEGISLQLDPTINVFVEVEPYVREALLELQSPIVRLREMAGQMGESAEAMMLLPKQLQHMLEEMEAGDTSVSFKIEGLDEPTRRVTLAANRLMLAILAAAFVIGPALLLPRLSEVNPDWQAGAIFLVLSGFAMSLVLTLGLILSLWRSRR